MSQLIVGLTPALARALERGERTVEATRLRDLTTQAHLELSPQLPRSLETDGSNDTQNTEDTDQVVWFSTETGEGDPEDLSTRLLQISGVTAAFGTPPQGPP